MKNKMQRKLWKTGVLALSASLLLGLAGCGGPQNIDGNDPGSNSVVTESTNDTTGEKKEEASGTQAAVTEKSEHLDSLLGDWSLIAVIYDEDALEIAADSGFDGDLSIYTEDGKYKMDYSLSEYESYTEMEGMTLKEGNGSMFNGTEKADWYADVLRRKEGASTYAITKRDNGTLLLQIRYEYSYEGEESGVTETSVYDNYYVYADPKAENLAEIEDSYRYRETVTVSNIKELYEAIGSRKHIILKAGTYNISQLPLDQRKNENLNVGFYDGEYYDVETDTIYMSWLNNIILEGEEGAEVMICTEDGYESPLSFENCSRITLKNLTLGHEVEPGYCSGAVVYMDGCNNFTVENCRLYGSGTYGFEARYSGYIDVKDCDIYECTYGAVYLNCCNFWKFSNSKLRDSSEFSILDMVGCWDIEYENCSITGNRSSGQYSALIDCSDASDITFTGCTIKDNTYDNFQFGQSAMINCTVEK